MGGGPPSFPPNITCWAVLTVLHHWWDRVVAYGTLTRSGLPFQYSSADGPPSQRGVGIPLHPDRTTPHRQRIPARTPMRFGLCPVRSPLLRASSLFLGVLRCFSSPGSLPLRVDRPSRLPGCPIRRSRDYRVPAPPPSISLRGRVLPRLQAPRHPPSAHIRRALSRSAARASVPHAGRRLSPGRFPTPGNVTHVHLTSSLLGSCCCVFVCATCVSSDPPLQPDASAHRGSGPPGIRSP